MYRYLGEAYLYTCMYAYQHGEVKLKSSCQATSETNIALRRSDKYRNKSAPTAVISRRVRRTGVQINIICSELSA
jgi:hypothetical protein